MDEVEVRYCGILSSLEDKHLLVFQERHGRRGCLIDIHPIVARAAAYEEKGIKPVLPSTHQLLCNIIDVAGLNIEKAILAELINGVSRFNIVVRNKDNEVLSIEASLADSLIISIIKNCPIFVNGQLLIERDDISTIAAKLDEMRHPRTSTVDPTKSMSDEELIHYFKDIDNLPEA